MSAATSDVASAPPSDGTIKGLIDANVRCAPSATAILAPGRAPLTYGELSRQISDTARALAASGLGSASRVAVVLHNGPETAATLVAVMCCATCVPLNPNLDEAALRSLCKRLRVDAMIAAPDAAPSIRRIADELRLPLLSLVVAASDPAGTFRLEGGSSGSPVSPTAPRPDDIALVLNTSGTTGRSKTVALTQRSQVDSARYRVDHFRMSSGDRGLCIAPMFNASAIRRSLLPPLAAGGSIVCPVQFDADRMLDWLVEFAPTFYAAGPAIHRSVLEAVARRGGPPRHALAYIVSGSTALPPALQASLENTFGVPLIQTYAMTETGGIAQNPLPPGARRHGSVGRPGPCEVTIRSADGDVLEVGRSGEIAVRGPQVFGGYENDPEATRQAFWGDWFRTGDVGHFDGEGYLYVTGRLKEIINRGGFKVPPEEVDAVLLQHPDVAEVATFSVAHPTLGDDVVAAVVLRKYGALTSQQLRDFAFGALPAFKVPSSIVIVPAIPKTPAGKVRRLELSDILHSTLRPPYVAPRDADEIAVARIFADVLGIEPIGAFDNFFALGGDSLRSGQATVRANAVFGCSLDAATLFRRPSVAEFAGEIKSRVQRHGTSASRPIARLPRNESVRGTGRPPVKR